MASEWIAATIDDIVASSRNALVGGPFGSNLVSRDYVSEGVLVIRGQNMGTRWVTGNFVFVTPKKANSLGANLARPGDIVLTQRGTLGQVSIVPSTSFSRYLVSQSQMKVTLNREIADPLFFYYVLSSSEQQDYVRQNAIQTGVPHTNLGILRSTPVPLPPLPEQQAIAQILGKLDDKIELNRQMNQTLEEMSRALFKSWFVDFDPVHAKATLKHKHHAATPSQGGSDWTVERTRAYLDRMDPNIAALFPDSFMDSELGLVPEGWRVVPLAEVIEVNPPRPLGRGYIAPYLAMANMPKKGHKPETVIDRPFGSGKRFTNGDTLFARITPCLENGKTAYVDFLKENQIDWGSTEYIVLRPKSPLPSEFAYCLGRSAGFREFAIQNMTGTSGRQCVPAAALSGFLMPSPPARIAAEFGRAARTLLLRAKQAVHESWALTALRDILLPKLIAGELRISVDHSSISQEVG